MESLTPAFPCVPQNSKKRRFPGGSSSGCKDVEVLEITPPINRTSKPKPLKQKEDHCYEIVDVDMDEVCGDDVLIDREVGTSGKGEDAFSNFSVGLSSLSNDGSGSEVQFANNVAVGSHTSVNADDFSSNLFYGEDEWIDMYYDDISYDDDHEVLESQFDHMDIPPGVEAPFPWLPTFPGNYKKSTNATTNSSSELQLDGVNPSPHLNLSHLPLPSKPVQIRDQSTSTSYSVTVPQENADSHPLKAKQPCAWLEPSPGHNNPATSTSTSHLSLKSSGGFLPHKSEKETLPYVGKMRLRSRVSHGSYSSPQYQNPSKETYFKIVEDGNAYPGWSVPTSMSKWNNWSLNTWEPSTGPSGFMNESSFVPWAQGLANDLSSTSFIGTSAPTQVEHKNVDEIVQNLNHFKKLDTVEDHSDHYYSKNGYSTTQPPKIWAKRIQEEWKTLEKDLPDMIFVRVYESRMDLLRAVIVGADGTPYHDGIFFFDVFFPCSYPNVPPHVHYHSGGLRINPNLYNCGKVCLSLLNTWTGSQKEKWIPGVSTMLQVLVSIQGLILNAKPYFNEPGYANMRGSPSGEKKSLEYNERTFICSLQTMVYNMRRPPKYFEDFVAGHFCKYAREILASCKAYLNGAQVGSLAKGGAQDVDEGDKSCSKHFKPTLAGFIHTLVNSFSTIGAKDCHEFLYLAQKATEPDAAPVTQNFLH